ncbi:hypothetical protein ACK1KB_04745 [Chryseobacterium sp. TY3]
MSPPLKSFLKRLLLVVIPIIALYLYAQMAFEANSHLEHRTDAGLGIAFMTTGLLLILFQVFLVDIITKIRIKNYNIVKIDAVFLLILSTPIAYLICQITSRNCFCTSIINSNDAMF